jgi:uncharacterized protein (TIGR03435 family)
MGGYAILGEGVFAMRFERFWVVLAAVLVAGTMMRARAQGPDAAPVRMAATADPAFDVATIKPTGPEISQLDLNVRGRAFQTRYMTLADLMEFVYSVQAKQIVGGPEWVTKDRFDVTGVPDLPGEPSVEQWKTMLRKLLAERFKLAFHHETRELSVYALTVGKGEAKVTENKSGNTLPNLNYSLVPAGVLLHPSNARMADFCEFLQVLVVDRPVVDQTGLTGRYDFSFTFMPDESLFRGHPPMVPNDNANAAPGFFTAIRTTGLQLDPVKTQADVLVIDRAEKPSEN